MTKGSAKATTKKYHLHDRDKSTIRAAALTRVHLGARGLGHLPRRSQEAVRPTCTTTRISIHTTQWIHLIRRDLVRVLAQNIGDAQRFLQPTKILSNARAQRNGRRTAQQRENIANLARIRTV